MPLPMNRDRDNAQRHPSLSGDPSDYIRVPCKRRAIDVINEQRVPFASKRVRTIAFQQKPHCLPYGACVLRREFDRQDDAA